MPVEVPQVLQLQGGTPQQTVGTVFAEKLKIIKSMQGGTMGGSMLSNLLGSAGLSSITQNPILGVAQTIIGQVTSMLSSQGSGSVLTAPLTALNASTNIIMNMAGALSGASAITPEAPNGPIDLMMHAQSLTLFEGAEPPAIGLAAAAAPLTAGPMLTALSAGLTTLATGLAAGIETPAAAAPYVGQAASDLAALATAATGAITGLRLAMMPVVTASMLGAATVSPPPGMEAILPLILQPAAFTAMQEAATAAYYIAPPTVNEEIAPTLNLNSEVMQWIMTNMSGGVEADVVIEVI